MTKSFQIIFKEHSRTYSAIFNTVIPLTCSGKFIDINGLLHNMNLWNRYLHHSSTLNKIVHEATLKDIDNIQLGSDILCQKTMCHTIIDPIPNIDASSVCKSENIGIQCLNVINKEFNKFYSGQIPINSFDISGIIYFSNNNQNNSYIVISNIKHNEQFPIIISISDSQSKEDMNIENRNLDYSSTLNNIVHEATLKDIDNIQLGCDSLCCKTITCHNIIDPILTPSIAETICLSSFFSFSSCMDAIDSAGDKFYGGNIPINSSDISANIYFKQNVINSNNPFFKQLLSPSSESYIVISNIKQKPFLPIIASLSS